MPSWGPSVYGDPCRECGFGWSLTQADAMTLIEDVPRRYRDLLRGRDASQRHPDLAWSAGAYVCHVNDNLRIWAERLAGLARIGSGPVAPYDPDALAEARVYEEVPVEAALWSLTRAAREWADAIRLGTEAAVVLLHPDRGPQSVTDVARTNAHDAYHHQWDIRRSLADD